MSTNDSDVCQHPNLGPCQWPTCCIPCDHCGRDIIAERYEQHLALCSRQDPPANDPGTIKISVVGVLPLAANQAAGNT
ncbi:MAG: hypothetical protein WC497_05070 [Patescibacteria group bacterium]